MPTVLFTWELGSGLGHLLPLRAIAEEMLKRGHKVIMALRDLSRVPEVFDRSAVTFISIPMVPARSTPPEGIRGYADILDRIGFGDEWRLSTLLVGWHSVFANIRPDLVVTDHSPVALTALWGSPIKRVNMGTGFCCPPQGFPLPYWSQKERPLDNAKIVEHELLLTRTANTALGSLDRPRLERLGQLFNQINGVVLATYREFDPFERADPHYWGHLHTEAGVDPIWPEVKGPKIYAYLKPFRGLGDCLRALQGLGFPTLVYSGGIDPALREQYGGPTLRFENRMVNITQAARECDLAISHAGHGTLATILLAGKPLLTIPLVTEQLLNAQAVVRLGAGKYLLPKASAALGPAVREMLNAPSYTVGAKAFASRYSGFAPSEQTPKVADYLETMLAT